MAEWHFDKHKNGWAWRCTTESGAVESLHHFKNIYEAVADATVQGYVSGKSRIGSVGPVAESRLRASRTRRGTPGRAPQGKIVFKRNLRRRWRWELWSREGKLLIRSQNDFATREECAAHARASGQKVPALKVS